MLVLSRKPGERIHIGSEIAVTILDVNGKLVRLGIEAPRSVGIFRAELYEQIEAENKIAAQKSNYLDKLKRLSSILGPKR